MISGRKIVVFPYFYENPYLNLTYLAAQAEGSVIVPATKLKGFVAAAAELESGDIMHIHWTNRVVQSAKDEETAIAALDAFRAAVLAAKQRGVKLLWTVHNRIPHETTWFELERTLSQFLADNADRVLVMSPATAEVVADVFTLPSDKSVMLPHPSYQGIYAPADGDKARAELGVPADLPTALFFGQMRAYKGIATLIEAAALAVKDGAELGLLLAGKTSKLERQRIDELLPPNLPVVRHHDFVADADLPLWFAAADVAVFPYTDVLNSGSIHLAATLGVPVILPDIPHLVDQFADQSWVHFYRVDEGAEDLARVLAALPLFAGSAAAGREFAASLSPYVISERFAELVEQV